MGGTMATTAATATALHGNLTAYHGSPRGTPMPTAPSLGLGLGLGLEIGFHGMPVEARVEGSVVCRGGCREGFCRRWCQVMPRRVAKKGNNVHASLRGMPYQAYRG